MKRKLHIVFSFVLLGVLPSFLSGCYTQLATTESAYDESQVVEDTAIVEMEEFDRDYPPPDYYLGFSYYHPGFTVLYGSYDPWYSWYYPGSAWYYPWYPPYYPVYTCWPYYPSWYYPYPVIYHGGGHGGYYPGGGIASQTRDFGRSRGFGDQTGTRGRGGVIRGNGGDDADPVTVLPASISRPSRQGGATISGNTGKKADPPQRRAAVNRPPARKVQPDAAPSTRGNSGSSRGGSEKSSVSSTPRSSPPPAPANSGSRGASGSGGNRGGGPRSR